MHQIKHANCVISNMQIVISNMRSASDQTCRLHYIKHANCYIQHAKCIKSNMQIALYQTCKLLYLTCEVHYITHTNCIMSSMQTVISNIRNVRETGRDLITHWTIVPRKFRLFVASLVFTQTPLGCRGPGGLVSRRAFSPQHPEKSIDQARDITWLSCNDMILCRLMTWYHVKTWYNFITLYHVMTWYRVVKWHLVMT